MKQITRIALASIIASAGVHNSCCAKPFICKAYDYAKRATLLATPAVLSKLTYDFILKPYVKPHVPLDRYYTQSIVLGIYAAYFWHKALQQKLKA